MHPYSPQSFVQRKKPSLDMVAPRTLNPVSVAPAFPVSRMTKKPIQRKGLDGIHTERRSLLSALKERSPKHSVFLFARRSQIYLRRTKRLLSRLLPEMEAKRMVYASIVSGIAFGMVSMAFIAHIFGPGVFARSTKTEDIKPIQKVEEATEVTLNTEYDPDQDVFFEYFDEATQEQYEENIRNMVKGYPIEAMLPYIFEQDRLTAAFLVGIAKKESNWGKRVPVLDGQDCFNYWGYRGVRRMMGTGGHTCFNSRKDAVQTVANRLNQLIHSQKLDTPEKLIVWKCGFSCEGHSRESVKKWISDVDMYYEQLKDE